MTRRISTALFLQLCVGLGTVVAPACVGADEIQTEATEQAVSASEPSNAIDPFSAMTGGVPATQMARAVNAASHAADPSLVHWNDLSDSDAVRRVWAQFSSSLAATAQARQQDYEAGHGTWAPVGTEPRPPIF